MPSELDDAVDVLDAQLDPGSSYRTLLLCAPETSASTNKLSRVPTHRLDQAGRTYEMRHHQRIIFRIQSDSSGKSVITASVASRGGEANSWCPIEIAPDLTPSIISWTPPSCEFGKT